eukprot:431315_1
MLFESLLLVHFFEISITFANEIAANISNTSGDYYFLTNNGNYDKSISCSNPSGCYVECNGYHACKSFNITAHSTNWLTLKCHGGSACYQMNLLDGPIYDANIECISSEDNSCQYAKFSLITTNVVTLECNNYIDSSTYSDYSSSGSCYGATLHAEYTNKVYINCNGTADCRSFKLYANYTSSQITINSNGYESLYQSKIYSANSGELEINCNNGSSCSHINIYPPYNMEYGFTLNCISIPYSCSSVHITVPRSDTFKNNYMQLLCPRTSVFTQSCDVQWTCLDIGTSTSTSTSFSSSHALYTCDNDDCCPWINFGYIQQSIKIFQKVPNSIQPNIINSSGEFYILDNSNSYKQILCGNSIGCYIDCTVHDSCNSATIYASLTNYLSLNCNSKSGCYKIYIQDGPINQADIQCTSKFGQSCYYGAFLMHDTKSVNLQCDQQDYSNSQSYGSCYGVSVWAHLAESVSINCNSYYDCSNAQFVLDFVSKQVIIVGNGYKSLSSSNIGASKATSLNVSCNSGYACSHTNIYPPYHTIHDFNLICSSLSSYSCYYTNIYVQNNTVTVNNYMQLTCAYNLDYYYTCDVQFHCIDEGLTTDITYSNIDSRYKCSNNNCCGIDDDNVNTNSSTLAVIFVICFIGGIFVICYLLVRKVKQQNQNVANVMTTIKNTIIATFQQNQQTHPVLLNSGPHAPITHAPIAHAPIAHAPIAHAPIAHAPIAHAPI